MASILFERRDAPEAIERCQSALAVDPRREEVHRELMKFMWQSGRPTEALEQYEECRRLLQEKIGVEPTRETQSLRDTILAGEFNGEIQ